MDHHYTAFDLPVRINYVPPRWLASFIYISHLFAGICLLWVNLPLAAKLLLLCMVIISLYIYASRHRRLLQAGLPLYLLLNERDEWSVVTPDGRRQHARLRSASILQPDFITLVFRVGKIKHVFILTGSNLDQQTLRRLRVRLYYPRRRG